MHPALITEMLPNAVPLDMVFVEGGAFDMGSAGKEADPDEKPVHRVRLLGFYLGRYPVTQAQWKAILNNNPSSFKGDDRPVEQVSWFDAVVFCNALSLYSKKEPCYFSDAGFTTPYGKTADDWTLRNEGPVFFKNRATGFRLPSEAEWEYAARGGPFGESENYLYAGSDLLEQVAWYHKNNSRETEEVGLLLPNALGLYDMSGNVREWCADHWHDSYKNAPDDGWAWIDSGRIEGTPRVGRGGSWGLIAEYCRATYRYHRAPGNRVNNLGFRLAFSSQSSG